MKDLMAIEELKLKGLRSGGRLGFLLLPLLFNIVLYVPSQCNESQKDIKDIQIGKEEIKLSLFTDDTIINIENPMESAKKKILE